jgi:hypothetical protein
MGNTSPFLLDPLREPITKGYFTLDLELNKSFEKHHQPQSYFKTLKKQVKRKAERPRITTV